MSPENEKAQRVLDEAFAKLRQDHPEVVQAIEAMNVFVCRVPDGPFGSNQRRTNDIGECSYVGLKAGVKEGGVIAISLGFGLRRIHRRPNNSQAARIAGVLGGFH